MDDDLHEEDGFIEPTICCNEHLQMAATALANQIRLTAFKFLTGLPVSTQVLVYNHALEAIQAELLTGPFRVVKSHKN